MLGRLAAGGFSFVANSPGGPPEGRSRRRLRTHGPQTLISMDLLHFLSDRDRGVPGHDPACRPGHDGFILEPQESEVVDALGEVWLDDDVTWNHGTRNVSVVGAVVAVRLYLRDRTDASYIRSAGYRVRAQNV